MFGHWATTLTGCAAAFAALASAGTTSSNYYLKTHVTDGGDAKFDGLYLESYHTGAGFSDATFSSDNTNAIKGFLNDTRQVFDFGNDVVYGMNLNSHYQSTAFTFATIDGGEGDAGFSLDGNSLTWNNTNFAGWLVCDWWHGVPQLFWQLPYYDIAHPSTCSNITLVTEASS
ncbi:MAG: hypothetical protein M4579_000308 [Chaenotheca gracillima]|nr:MAG: hypothetical protein M4579_000308 [Chaenotheca gracillima]